MSNKLYYLFCFVLVLVLTGSIQAEILLNPGFEDGEEFWATWGGGSGSGAGGYFWDSSYGSTVIEDGTAHGGDKYMEAILRDTGLTGWWWNGMWVMTNYPVTEGKTYQFSAWVRDGDADGATSLIPNGIEITYEWRVAPPDSPTGPRYDEVDPDGDGNTGEHRNNFSFDLTGEWTYVSAEAIAPETAQGVTVGVVARVGIKYDTDDASFIEVGGKASSPDPADGSYIKQTFVNLVWKPGNSAVSHDVYVGDNFDDVNDGTGDTFRGNQNLEYYTVGFAGGAFPDGLINGTTYYWRIDEVNDADPNSPYKGNVWSFTVQPKTAYIPKPADGAEFINLNTQLTWATGYEAKLHTLYISDDFDDVNNGTDGISLGLPNYSPDSLKLANTYYWRVDEFDGAEVHKGDIWNFTTVGAVSGPNPVNGQEGVKPSVTLSWDAGTVAASHEVYFGADADAVANATNTSPEYKGPQALGEESYDPGKLTLNTEYYWRIDEVNGVNPDSPWAGKVWSFTTGDHFVIDDFEIYDANENQIWWSWKDGLGYVAHGTEPAYPGNGTGSAVGDENTLSFMEEIIVHGGLQSLPLFYDNNKPLFANYSEAALTLTDQRDWTEGDVAELSIWFSGDPSNAPEPMYVAISNVTGAPAVVVHDDPAAATIDTWTEWVIPLQSFVDQGINLSNVDKIAIGLGTQGNTTIPGGSGKMLIDDIRLYLATETAE
ncbi:MAG: carbohydrate binding domain-containing protein [Planctomycetota bacterium]|jgi:hypothetical protein